MQVKDSKRKVFAHVCLEVHMFSVNVTDTIKFFFTYIFKQYGVLVVSLQVKNITTNVKIFNNTNR